MHAYGTCKASDVDAVTFIDLYRADRLWLFMKVVATLISQYSSIVEDSAHGYVHVTIHNLTQ